MEEALMRRCAVYSHLKFFCIALLIPYWLGTVGHSQELGSQAVWALCEQERYEFITFAKHIMWNFPAHTSAEDIVHDACIRAYKAVEKGKQQFGDLRGLLRLTITRVIWDKKRLQETWREVRDTSTHLVEIAEEPDISDVIDARETLATLQSHLGDAQYGILVDHAMGQSVAQIAAERQLEQEFLRNRLLRVQRQVKNWQQSNDEQHFEGSADGKDARKTVGTTAIIMLLLILAWLGSRGGSMQSRSESQSPQRPIDRIPMD
jgi:DNA-directed RNA polymerase specialized sigma24 family protein